jgi:type IV secretory pathway VirB4 component
VLSYLFHRIEGELNGRPTLLIIDEGWLALDDTNFAQQLRERLKTLTAAATGDRGYPGSMTRDAFAHRSPR